MIMVVIIEGATFILRQTPLPPRVFLRVSDLYSFVLTSHYVKQQRRLIILQEVERSENELTTKLSVRSFSIPLKRRM